MIEVVLAAALFGLISVSLYAVFRQVILVGVEARQETRLVRRAERIMESITLDLENMLAFKESAVLSGGAFPEMTFVTVTAEGPAEVRYFLAAPLETLEMSVRVTPRRQRTGVISQKTTEQKWHWLMRAERPLRNDEENKSEKKQSVVSKGVIAGSLAFEFVERQTAPGKKLKLPSSPAFVPAGIKVRLTLAGPGKGSEPLNVEQVVLIPKGYWR